MPTNPWFPPANDTLTDGELTLLPWSRVKTVPGVRDDLFAASVDPRMVEWTTVPSPYTVEMAEAFLGDSGDGCARWALVVDDRYCGSIELRLDDSGGADFGYNTAPWARGRGLMTRAVRLVTDHAFAEGAPLLIIRALPGNAASRHVAEVNGFAFSGERDGRVEYVKHAE